MSTATKRPRRGGWKPLGETVGGSRSKQVLISLGTGQAKALNTAAANRTVPRAHNLGVRPMTRAELLREIVAWGLTRSVRDIRAQDPVPIAPAGTPASERQITWIPLAGQMDALTKQAGSVFKTSDPDAGDRNELLRRHIAAWLAEHKED